MIDEMMKIKIFRDLFTDGTLPNTSDASEWVEENYYSGYNERKEYVKKFGFSFITKEFIDDMHDFLFNVSDNNKFKTLEVCCGSGYLSMNLIKSGISMIATDDRSWRDTRNNFFNEDFTSIESIDAVEAIDKYHDEIKVVILSWPIYGSDLAYRILQKCFEYGLILIYIGEDIGGCTASDDFFEMIESENIIDDYYTLDENYVQFPSIYDHVHILKGGKR